MNLLRKIISNSEKPTTQHLKSPNPSSSPQPNLLIDSNKPTNTNTFSYRNSYSLCRKSHLNNYQQRTKQFADKENNVPSMTMSINHKNNNEGANAKEETQTKQINKATVNTQIKVLQPSLMFEVNRQNHSQLLKSNQQPTTVNKYNSHSQYLFKQLVDTCNTTTNGLWESTDDILWEQTEQKVIKKKSLMQTINQQSEQQEIEVKVNTSHLCERSSNSTNTNEKTKQISLTKRQHSLKQRPQSCTRSYRRPNIKQLPKWKIDQKDISLRMKKLNLSAGKIPQQKQQNIQKQNKEKLTEKSMINMVKDSTREIQHNVKLMIQIYQKISKNQGQYYPQNKGLFASVLQRQ